ncbi:hypothetical protein NP233_g11965 [Leucocoprinus birnbaumii]|uniref:Uncharacterized protein n=1 Tax=Leucocoprinus birnbaumii TaxID=56174 RepID=A0AAD5YKV3_9AGAR|nr:hypothetical protein NP233_g11965 [Leucocoprinus birnbaumii]
MTYPESVTESDSSAPSEHESDSGSESARLSPTHPSYFPPVRKGPDHVPQAKNPHTNKFFMRTELNIINSATHQALVSSGNEPYAQVLYEAQLTQAELRAFSSAYRLLCGILDKKLSPASNAADVSVPHHLATLTPSLNPLVLDTATITFASPPAAKLGLVKLEPKSSPIKLKAKPSSTLTAPYLNHPSKPTSTFVHPKPLLNFLPVKAEVSEPSQSLVPSSQSPSPLRVSVKCQSQSPPSSLRPTKRQRIAVLTPTTAPSPGHGGQVRRPQPHCPAVKPERRAVAHWSYHPGTTR